MTSFTTHQYVIAYDVVDDLRRSRVAKTLQSYGDRVQYSVFWIEASPARVVRLRAALAQLVDDREDSVMVCDLGLASDARRGRVSYVGRARPVTPTDGIIL